MDIQVPNLNGYSPYELVFGHKMTLSHELIKVDTVVSGTFKDYYEKLKKNLQYMGERLQKFRSQRLDLLNKDREYQAFEVGQIVNMYQARGSVVETGSRKIRCNYVGPLVIFKAAGPNQFLLMYLVTSIPIPKYSDIEKRPIIFNNCTEDLNRHGARTRGYPQYETYNKCNRVLAQQSFIKVNRKGYSLFLDNY